jgi:AraC-like DNA-binding protein
VKVAHPAVNPAHRDLPWDLRTPDLARVRREIARLLKPFELSGHSQHRYDARLLHRRLRRTTLALIDYGGAVTIDAGLMSHCYLLQVPLEGSYRLQSSGRAVEVETRCAHVVHPGMPLVMEWSRDCRVLVLRFEESMLAPRGPDPGGAVFQSWAGDVIRLDSEPNRSLGRLIDYVTREAIEGRLFERTPQAAAQVENLLVSSLLATFDARGPASRRDSMPEYMLRAEEFVVEHLAESLTIADIARAASASTRTLFDGFKRTHGSGPLAWMRARRLDRARTELLAAEAGVARITDVAMRWGFTHMGRFCVAYRNRFGETPRQTLHRDRDTETCPATRGRPTS